MKTFNKETVILVIYVDISMLDAFDIPEYMGSVLKYTKLGGNIIQHIIPIYGESRIECVYPKFIVSEDEFNRVNDEIKLIEENLLNIIKK